MSRLSLLNSYELSELSALYLDQLYLHCQTHQQCWLLHHLLLVYPITSFEYYTLPTNQWEELGQKILCLIKSFYKNTSTYISTFINTSHYKPYSWQHKTKWLVIFVVLIKSSPLVYKQEETSKAQSMLLILDVNIIQL